MKKSNCFNENENLNLYSFSLLQGRKRTLPDNKIFGMYIFDNNVRTVARKIIGPPLHHQFIFSIAYELH